MARLQVQPSFICIRDCFTFNKRFRQGEAFPEDWLKAGYKPNRHFAPAQEAANAIAEVNATRQRYGHGDDPRSTVELKKELSKFTEVDGNWDRKRTWMELQRYENAEAKDGKRPPGRPPNKDK